MNLLIQLRYKGATLGNTFYKHCGDTATAAILISVALERIKILDSYFKANSFPKMQPNTQRNYIEAALIGGGSDMKSPTSRANVLTDLRMISSLRMIVACVQTTLEGIQENLDRPDTAVVNINLDRKTIDADILDVVQDYDADLPVLVFPFFEESIPFDMWHLFRTAIETCTGDGESENGRFFFQYMGSDYFKLRS